MALKEVATIAQYRGHRIRGDQAQLMYDLYAEGNVAIRVTETVDFVESESGQVGLARTFTTSNVPEGYSVAMQTNINSIASRRNVETNGHLTVYEEETKEFGNLELLEIEGQVELNSNGSTDYTVMFVGRPTIKNKYVPSEGNEEDLPLGQRLIARNDCKTCHNQNVKTIGPAYVDIAERYATNEQNINLLVQKVIEGGSGVWGIQLMSPHPELPVTDARSMIEWILSLDGEEMSDGDAEVVEAMPLEPIELDESSLLPGAITEVYDIPSTTSALPDKAGRRADMAGVMSAYANMSNSHFGDLDYNFSMYGSGYLKIETGGVYKFRLWSDDGSKLWINDELIIDNDGLHGTQYTEAAVQLDKGFYPFRLGYFQGAGDRFLSFNYQFPGTSEFATVPLSMIFHDPTMRPTDAANSLAMAVARRVPGDRFPLVEVHPSYDLTPARPEDFLPKVGGMDFLDDGRLVVCTWDPSGAVYILDNLDAEKAEDITVTKIASGLAEPLGLKVVDNEIYVLQKQELTKLVDTDNDDLIDEYHAISNQWKTSANFHEFAFGLEYQDGFFFGNLATAIQPGGASTDPQIEDRGKVMKIDASNGRVEFLAHGLRTPNGIGFGVDGELFVSDNQGDWLPSSKILHVKEGAWFGSRSVDFAGTAGLKEQLPVVWLPQDEIGNSPSTPLLLEDGPYAGQMMHGEVTHGGIKRVFVENIEGNYQGAVFRFIQGLEAGVNRLTISPDGAIYAGGIGNPGNWNQSGKLWYGLEKLQYNGNPTFEMLAVRAKSNGVEIEFTEPLREGEGWDAGEYSVTQWQYIPTEEYGGPKENEERLSIKSASVSTDRKRVFLELGGMKEDRVVHVHLQRHFISANGNQLWSTEAWYTMNNIPADNPGVVSSNPIIIPQNTLTSDEKNSGWKLLFDGESFEGWKRYRQDDIGDSWVIEDGAIKLNARKDENGKWYVEDRGDIMTKGEYENFELNLEWKISDCGNSGIMFSVNESEEYGATYSTGPEMQILDNSCHPDARYPTHRAGDLYDMIECKYETVAPAGEWNRVRLIKNNGKVEHWLNGVKVVEYEMYNDTWNEMVAESKFKGWKGFGEYTKGHIALQDHGDAQVWFRNIKIREL